MSRGLLLSSHHTGDAQDQQPECDDGQNGVDMFIRYSHLGAKLIKFREIRVIRTKKNVSLQSR
jgi:hypothetical protein